MPAKQKFDLKAFVSPKVFAEMVENIDTTRAIMSHFFEKHVSDYRNMTISFLANRFLDFYSEGNLAHDVARRFIQVKCPYCGHTMRFHHSGGNSDATYATYSCGKCKAEAITTVDIRFYSNK